MMPEVMRTVLAVGMTSAGVTVPVQVDSRGYIVGGTATGTGAAASGAGASLACALSTDGTETVAVVGTNGALFVAPS